jgi:hypothetical protein
MTAYHPQSNGLVEQFHRQLKDALRSRAAAADWHDHLPWVLLGIRTAFREDSEFSPAEAVYGSQLVLPGQLINTAELERSTHFFLLEMGDRTDKVSTLRLKVARMPADTEPAKPPRRGRPVAQAPPVRAPPPKQRGRPRQVTFSLPPTTPTTTTSTSSASGRPLRTARPPNRLNL